MNKTSTMADAVRNSSAKHYLNFVAFSTVYCHNGKNTQTNDATFWISYPDYNPEQALCTITGFIRVFFNTRALLGVVSRLRSTDWTFLIKNTWKKNHFLHSFARKCHINLLWSQHDELHLTLKGKRVICCQRLCARPADMSSHTLKKALKKKKTKGP